MLFILKKNFFADFCISGDVVFALVMMFLFSGVIIFAFVVLFFSRCWCYYCHVMLMHFSHGGSIAIPFGLTLYYCLSRWCCYSYTVLLFRYFLTQPFVIVSCELVLLFALVMLHLSLMLV